MVLSKEGNGGVKEQDSPMKFEKEFEREKWGVTEHTPMNFPKKREKKNH
jgi:hypothetical protein